LVPNRPLMIGIAGGTGSGKTTVARRVAAALADSSVAFVEMDSYYRNHVGLSMAELHRINWDHPDAFDLDLFVEQLDAMSKGETIDKPIYDYSIHARSAETVRIAKVDVVVVDGILLFTDEQVRQRLDVKVFVDADADIRLVRRIKRDMATRGRPLEEILEQYVNTVRPMHLQFIEPSKRWADVIVPRGGHNTVAIEMILAKIRQRLATHGVPHIPMVADENRLTPTGSHPAIREGNHA
jgi:uridine kinase